MKQVVYTCERCGKQAAVDTGPDNGVPLTIPMEWAVVHYGRLHTVNQDGNARTVHTTSTTHACGDCAESALHAVEARKP